MYSYKNKNNALITFIALTVTCLFLADAVVLANIDTLSPAVGNPDTYQVMAEIMDKRLAAHQKPIDDFIIEHADSSKAFEDVPRLEDEFTGCVKRCGAESAIVRLNEAFRASGGRIQVIFVKNESELPKFEGKTVWGHAGKYVTVFAIEGEERTARGRGRIIGRIFHEIRARSTLAKDIFDREFKDRKPETPKDVRELAERLRKEFEKNNETIQTQIERYGQIENLGLRREFQNLAFAGHPDPAGRDYTAGESPPDGYRGKIDGILESIELPDAERRTVLSKIFVHNDGIGIGATIVSLKDHGILDLFKEKDSVTMEDILNRAKTGNTGYLHVAMRLLAAQGWVMRTGPPASNSMKFTITPKGRIAIEMAEAYRYPSELFKIGTKINDSPELYQDMVEQSGREWDLPQEDVAEREVIRREILDNLDGIMIGPTMVALKECGLFDLFKGRAPLKTAYIAGRIPMNIDVLITALDLLSNCGWVVRKDDTFSLTPKGRFAASRAWSYATPVSYFPTFAQIDELLFGDPSKVFKRDAQGNETNLDRRMNIKASGIIHASYFKQIDEIAIDIFNQPIEKQPRFIADMGCGSGTLLKHLYQLVMDNTLRGRLIRESPDNPQYKLLMIGADFNKAARSEAIATLDSAGIPNIILHGDINNPDGFAKELGRRGISIKDGLHVRSFLDHNRPYIAPARIDKGRTSRSASAFTDRGRAIQNVEMEQDLVDHLRQWAPHVTEHGLLILELHTIPPELAAKNIGKTLATAYDAIHGYSDQYLVELDVFLKSAAEAGLIADTHYQKRFPDSDLAAISINYFKSTQSSGIPPDGSVAGVFNYLCDHNCVDGSSAISGRAIAEALGPDGERSIRALHRFELAEARKESGQETRYFVPESVKAKQREMSDFLCEEFAGRGSRPASRVALNRDQKQERINDILGIGAPSEDQAILAMAEDITFGEEDPAEKVLDIVNWVNNRIELSAAFEWPSSTSASETLARRRGTYFDRLNLVVALARAIGIETEYGFARMDTKELKDAIPEWALQRLGNTFERPVMRFKLYGNWRYLDMTYEVDIGVSIDTRYLFPGFYRKDGRLKERPRFSADPSKWIRRRERIFSTGEIEEIGRSIAEHRAQAPSPLYPVREGVTLEGGRPVFAFIGRDYQSDDNYMRAWFYDESEEAKRFHRVLFSPEDISHRDSEGKIWIRSGLMLTEESGRPYELVIFKEPVRADIAIYPYHMELPEASEEATASTYVGTIISYRTYGLLTDKARQSDFFRQAGLPCPDTTVIARSSAKREAYETIGELVRRTGSSRIMVKAAHGGDAVYQYDVSHPTNMRNAANRICLEKGDVVVQRRIEPIPIKFPEGMHPRYRKKEEIEKMAWWFEREHEWHVRAMIYKTSNGEIKTQMLFIIGEFGQGYEFVDLEEFKKIVDGRFSAEEIERSIRLLSERVYMAVEKWAGEDPVLLTPDFMFDQNGNINILEINPGFFSIGGNFPEIRGSVIRGVFDALLKRAAHSQDAADIERAVALMNGEMADELERGRVYEVRYDSARLGPTPGMSGESSARALFDAYIQCLRMKVPREEIDEADEIIKLIECPSKEGEERPLISVTCYEDKRKTRVIGESRLNVKGDLVDQPIRIVGMLNMVFAASNIPNDAGQEDISKYGHLIELIRAQYSDLAGKEMPQDNILQAIRLIELEMPPAAAIPVNEQEAYYRLTIEKLKQAA